MKATSLRSKPDFRTNAGEHSEPVGMPDSGYSITLAERVIEIAIAVVISAAALLCACSWLKMLWPG